jgi:hypothetical protein
MAMGTRIAPLVLVVLAGGVAAQPRDACMETYNAEIVAVERDAKARQSTGSAAAKQRAAKGGEAQLAAAARRAKKCQEDAKAEGGAKPAAEDCRARTSGRAAEIERRFGSETLDPAQQSARREEEVRLQADLNECNRRAR